MRRIKNANIFYEMAVKHTKLKHLCSAEAAMASRLCFQICIGLLFLGQILGAEITRVKLVLNKQIGSDSEQAAEKEELGLGEKGKTLRFDLMHREAPTSPLRSVNATGADLLRRDEIRVQNIAARMKNLQHKGAGGIRQSSFEAPLRSGAADGSGEFFVSVGIGTPARTLHLAADTGSDVSWIQCSPCTQCYSQIDPIFDPSSSSSFSPFPCSASSCQQLRVKGCSKQNQCLYGVAYGDGSTTIGVLCTETITLGSTSIPKVALGCGRNNQGLFQGSAGLLGLGKGKLSFPTQVGPSFGNVFSYCLPSRLSVRTSPMIFGSGAVPSGSQFSPLVSNPNPKLDTFYYVSVIGIKVGGNPISIPSGAFSIDSSGNGGFILDCGTAVTRLVTSVYTPLRNAFRSGAQNLKSTSGVSILDTCYDLSGQTSVEIPTVTFVFGGGATMELPADNILVALDTSGTYCFAFAPDSSGFSILGNVQQQSFRMSFNIATKQLGIAANQCQ